MSDDPLTMSVCICPRAYCRKYTSNLRRIFMHVTRGLLWLLSDMLCTSGFMDDVILLRLLDIAAQQTHAASRDCNPGLVFPNPGFGIEDPVIPGSRRDYRISRRI